MRSEWLILGVGGLLGYVLLSKRSGVRGDAPKLLVTKSYLMPGDTGEDVRALQTALNYLGYSVGPVDGIYGSDTQTQVKRLQSDKGIPNDGIVGPQTRRAIDEELRKYGGSFVLIMGA